jgi:hypothetical protein
LKRIRSLFYEFFRFLDILIFFTSVVAVFGVVFLTIIHLDLYGQYRTFMNDIQSYGQEFSATITSCSDDYVFLKVNNHPEAGESYFSRTKYYYSSTLAMLEEGESIIIVAVPNKYRLEVREPGEALIQPYTDQVQRYTGFISQGPWVMWIICLVIVSIHPEVLYFALQIEEKPSKKVLRK